MIDADKRNAGYRRTVLIVWPLKRAGDLFEGIPFESRILEDVESIEAVQRISRADEPGTAASSSGPTASTRTKVSRECPMSPSKPAKGSKNVSASGPSTKRRRVAKNVPVIDLTSP